MADQKEGRRAKRGTESALVKALRQEGEELKLRIAKFEAECQTPQEKDKEVKLPTEMWVIIAGKLDKNDVCSFALVSKQLREAQVLAGRKLVTRPYYWGVGGLNVSYFAEDWCAYWSKKFNEDHTDPGVIKRVLYVTARHGYLEVFEKYWSRGPQEELSKLWDERTCELAAFHGHLEVMKWLRAKGCPWDLYVCFYAASKGHLEILRWARSQGCPWDFTVIYETAKQGHLNVLVWLINEGCPYDKSWCLEAAAGGGECARKILEWLDDETSDKTSDETSDHIGGLLR